MPFHQFNTKQIYYTETGSGLAIVLLHGFTESSKIWNRFVQLFSKEFRVITIDLPGHGQSEIVAPVHTMELMADVVNEVLMHLNVSICLMVGHSMGGYTTLAFGKKYGEKLKGFVIFHSHCFPDSLQDRELRDRTIKIVNEDKFGFLSFFIPGLFPANVQEKFLSEIDHLIKDAEGMSKEAVVAAIEGMKIRPDQSGFLQSTPLPVLFILGLNDSKAPIQKLWDMISLPAHSESLILRDIGHMGYIEAPEETYEAIRHFAMKIFAGL